MTLDIQIELDEQGVAKEANITIAGRSSEASDEKIFSSIPVALGGVYSQFIMRLFNIEPPKEKDEEFIKFTDDLARKAAINFEHGFKGYVGTDDSCSFEGGEGGFIEGEPDMEFPDKEEEDE